MTTTNYSECRDLGTGLCAFLAAAPAVRALAYSESSQGLRLGPTTLPQGETLPAIVYHEISADSDQTLDGRTGIANTRIQFDCYGKTAIEAQQLRLAVELALQGYRGPAGDEQILSVTIGSRRSDVQPRNDGTDEVDHIRQVDFLITHREAIQ